MSIDGLPTLHPLGPARDIAFSFPPEEVGSTSSLAPLAWTVWTGLTADVLPNPAPNRQTKAAQREPNVTNRLAEQLLAMSVLAQSLQKTSETVNYAHSIFVSNQENALEQIQQINHLFEAINNRH